MPKVKWTAELLFEELQGLTNGKRKCFESLLNWALETRIFTESKTLSPSIGICGKHHKKIMSFFPKSDDEACLLFNPMNYLGGAQKRDWLVDKLKAMDLLDESIDPESVKESRLLKQNISQMNGYELDEFKSVLQEFCSSMR